MSELDQPTHIHPDGTKEWRLGGYIHREAAPAIIFPDGTQIFYKKGMVHRLDGPAIIRPDSTLEYYQNGRLHREDGPAIIRPDGTKEFWLHGRMMRKKVNGKPLGPTIILPDGTEEYHDQGRLHNDLAPALIAKDNRTGLVTHIWFQGGRMHRDPDADGTLLPAYECSDGTKAYYIQGEKQTLDKKHHEEAQ